MLNRLSFLSDYMWQSLRLWFFAILSSTLAFGCTSSGIGGRVDWAAYEAHFPAYKTAPSNVVVVEIDEASLKKFGKWPLSRALYATAAENAFASGAAVVAIDVMFVKEYDTESDAKLARLAAENKNVVFAYDAFQPTTEARLYRQLAFAGPTMGHINVIGGFGNEPPAMIADIPRENSLVMTVAEIYCNSVVPKCTPKVKSSVTDMVYVKKSVNGWGINIHAPESVFKRVPFHVLVAGKVPRLRGKIVIFSPAAPSLNDLFWIPQGNHRLLLPGSIGLAYGIETAVAGTSLFVLPAWALVVSIAVGNGLVLLLCQRFKSYKSVWLGVYLVLLFATHWAAFKYLHLHLPVSMLLANVICMWVTARFLWPDIQAAKIKSDSLPDSDFWSSRVDGGR